MGKPPTVTSALAGALPEGQGLLVAAVDQSSSSAVVVGSVPVDDGNFSGAAGESDGPGSCTARMFAGHTQHLCGPVC